MKVLSGSLVAIVTPMHEDGTVDYRALKRLIEWQIGQGSDGIVVAGTTGESATLNQAEHSQLISKAVAMVAGRVQVIAGTGANSTQEAIYLTRCEASAGADACLLVTPYYNRPTQEGLIRHYSAIAAAVDIPQILYNVPARTCCDMENDTVLHLSAIDNIIGLKDATGDLERLHILRAQLPEDFLLYSGDDASSREFLLAGGDGVITVTGNVAPRLMREMVDAARAGYRQGSIELDYWLQGLHKQLFIESSPIPSKWALHRMGLISKGIRLPLTWLSSECEDYLVDAMADAGIE
ncbi:MAG: 4-hydroxy-tetrahydrodipicolinate synthase [Sedimenticola sp.]